MDMTTARLRDFAASPTASKTEIRSASKSPLSAEPFSGGRPMPTSMSPILIFTDDTKLRSTLSARRVASVAFAMLSSEIRRCLRGGTSNCGSVFPSWASMCIVLQSNSSAMIWTSFNSTVFPTPRKPIKMKLLDERPARTRCIVTRASLRMLSRPASSGGLVPAPGAYGLDASSILANLIYLIFSKISYIRFDKIGNPCLRVAIGRFNPGGT